MTHAELKDLLGLHALGALERVDAAALEAHVGGCRSCRAELAELEDTAAELAHAAESVEPSAEVTHRILEAPRHDPQLSAVPSNLARRRPAAARLRFVPIAIRVAVGAAVAVLVVSQVTLLGRLDRALQRLERGRELVEMIASPDVTTVPLRAADALGGARALIAYDRRSGRAVLLAMNLPPPPADQVYQLWAIADGVRPGLAFSPDALGATLVRDEWVPERSEVPVFAVTLEPAPGTREPAGRIVMLGARDAGVR